MAFYPLLWTSATSVYLCINKTTAMLFYCFGFPRFFFSPPSSYFSSFSSGVLPSVAHILYSEVLPAHVLDLTLLSWCCLATTPIPVTTLPIYFQMLLLLLELYVQMLDDVSTWAFHSMIMRLPKAMCHHKLCAESHSHQHRSLLHRVFVELGCLE